ncbi:hypothetical protein BT63DRAFT_421716 [Microthyrium microscopicum]|uniref:Sodium/calcium exchanger membrane region domain-containing protein n=1 Tax=Microthyrium microscopicum TaxID=703497 RepID=A0A6A6UR89_9PEZI|nr:hypothetical protein BT63DRAFT_421716 [Microthyrium microscopicum]
MHRIRSGARAEASSRDLPQKDRGILPTTQPLPASPRLVDPTESTRDERGRKKSRTDTGLKSAGAPDTVAHKSASPSHDVEKSIPIMDSSVSPNTQSPGETSPPIDDPDVPPEKKKITTRMRDGMVRFGRHTNRALLHNPVNILLVFVPIGIAANFAHLSPGIIFGMNAIAIIPLAGVLTHATESVASRLGDTLGALLNVSFGNAVELIIFIALVKNEIRIVQASLLGSILANLLLILGMAFLFGGLRYREQIYNSTVTQMSACLLSLSVMSLLLPTAFHASFSDRATADSATLKMSRGTSVILLLVYGLYLLFQLKSHAYLYQSMPQEKIDEESHPGVLHDVFETSSSSSDSSSTDSDDTDTTSGSHTTAKRIKRAFRRRRRKSSGTTESIPSHISSRHIEAASIGESQSSPHPGVSRHHSALDVMSGDEGDNEATASRLVGISKIRDFEASGSAIAAQSPDRVSSPESHKFKFRRRKHKKNKKKKKKASTSTPPPADADEIVQIPVPAPRVEFVDEPTELPPTTPGSAAARSRAAFLRPGLPKLLSQNVFVDPLPMGLGGVRSTRPIRPAGPGRSSSLPDLARATTVPGRGYHPSAIARLTPKRSKAETEGEGGNGDEEEDDYEMSRTAAVVMLLASTALVALCAEFLVDAIPAMTTNSSVSQAFIGLIILPIVGNAAEHVTAVTVATKNKMDLAIGVAVGSSIQIALFVTPLVVLIGWIMNLSMSLYFTLFETISLFVTAFVVNFLVLDGKSNYLEGTLLISAYIIIAVAAFFYPDSAAASELGGSLGAANSTK